MGIAAIIPGVSSGTVAVLLKFYDKLVEAVDTIVSLKKGLIAAVIFLVLIYGGNFLALFTLAGPMNDLLENFPKQKTRIRPQKPEFTGCHTSNRELSTCPNA